MGAGALSLCGAGPVALRRKALVLLAYLALGPSPFVRRERLAHFLWPEADASRASNSLRQLLHQFSKLTGRSGAPVVVANRDQVRLAVGDLKIDIMSFEAGETPDWPDGLPPSPFELLHDIESGLEAELVEWLRHQRNLAAHRMEAAAKARLRTRHDPLALGVLEALWRTNPYQEDLLRELLSLKTEWLGWAAASPLFDEFHDIARRELGVDPQPQTQLLVAALSRPSGGGSPNEADVPEPRPRARLLLVQRHLRLPAETGPDRLSDLLLSDLVANVSQSPEILCSRVVLPVGAPLPGKAGFDFVLDLTCTSMADRYNLTWILEETHRDTIVDSDRDWIGRTDLIVLYDHVLGRLTRRIARDIAESRNARKFTPRTTSFTYSSFLRLRDDIGSCFDLKVLRSKRKRLTGILDEDPDFVPGKAVLARSYSQEWLLMQGLDKGSLARARDIAMRLIDEHPDDPSGFNEAGHAALHLGEIERALDHQRRALDLSPNSMPIRADFADVLSHAGLLERSLEQINLAIGAQPVAPDDYLWIKASTLFFLGDYDAAQAVLLRLRDGDAALRMRAACAAMAGRDAEARDLKDRSMQIYPDFRLDTYRQMVPAARAEQIDAYVDALRHAGFS